MKKEPFIPHALSYLEEIRAFPQNAMPEPAYKKLCMQYAESDVKTERVTYENDGLSITGLMATPRAKKPKGVVLYNRGGSGNYGILTVHAVMRQFVPLAKAGYLVIGSNYRGNDGGEGRDEFGGRDVDDALKLLDLVAPKDVPHYLIGHSRGGMESFLMMKRGFRPNAAIALAPVCDVRGWNMVPENLQEDRSAVCWPERIGAPLLIMHGTKDEAVPHGYSEALSEMLWAAGKQHELVLFDGGNHALTRFWDQVLEKSFAWMEKHA